MKHLKKKHILLMQIWPNAAMINCCSSQHILDSTQINMVKFNCKNTIYVFSTISDGLSIVHKEYFDNSTQIFPQSSKTDCYCIFISFFLTRTELKSSTWKICREFGLGTGISKTRAKVNVFVPRRRKERAYDWTHLL